ncbi:serine hydrolase [Nonomuraea sp. MCN248]|uniref:Serine hydrolase n=1 Tax=Nonomuraea corallina TaxID=2989783 RepID=A0ABT4SHX1_9ACTN|nr:serine hydrolase [Nonomuraea corallina]MDA0636822.1 serine hydrolase [Nonomuraea corallina]
MRIAVLAGSALVALAVGVSATPPAVAAEAPAVGAKQAFVIDSTGTVHFGKRETARVPVASLVKVMTAYVVLREARLTEVVTVTAQDVRYAARGGAATAGLRAGERLTVRDLLYALMLPSGADAANALARAYGPGKPAFIAKMNGTARRMGLRDTFYTNADGMPTPRDGGYSTAADQALLARYALEIPAFRTVVGRETHRVAKTALHPAHTWRNTNKLLGRAPGVVGVKTGYTRKAGYCLLFAAQRDGREVIGVLLGDRDERRFATAERLLEHATGRVVLG